MFANKALLGRGTGFAVLDIFLHGSLLFEVEATLETEKAPRIFEVIVAEAVAAVVILEFFAADRAQSIFHRPYRP